MTVKIPDLSDVPGVEAGDVTVTDDDRLTCPGCGQAYSTRGFKAHVSNCDAVADPTGDDASGRAQIDAQPSPSSDVTEADDGRRLTCPDCGNQRDGSPPEVVDADAARAALRERDALTDDRADLLDRFAYVCRACGEVFR